MFSLSFLLKIRSHVAQAAPKLTYLAEYDLEFIIHLLSAGFTGAGVAGFLNDVLKCPATSLADRHP